MTEVSAIAQHDQQHKILANLTMIPALERHRLG